MKRRLVIGLIVNIVIIAIAGCADQNGDGNTNTPNPFVTQFGSAGSGDGRFQDPRGIAVDDTYIYVADTDRDDVQVFRKSDHSFVAKFGGPGQYRWEISRSPWYRR